ASHAAEVFRFAETKARYIQVNMLYNSKNPGEHLREIKVFKAYENLGEGALLSSSGNLKSPEKIVDGDFERFQYATFKGDGFVEMDLNKQVTASKFRLYLEHEGGLKHKYTLEVSPDGKSWNMLFDKRINKENTPLGPLILTFPKQTFRYVRLNNFGTNYGSPFQIREIEVLED
ncbi:MAG: discoidin domain-containing protein, partial [Lentisphaeraceae bacterium]|nr:discoidin domain-containing protein [Lentisphaeraceae bacterium]